MLSKNKVLIFTPYAEPEKGACTIRINFFYSTLKKFGFEPLIVAPERNVGQSNGVIRIKSIFDLLKIIFLERPLVVIGVSPPLNPNIFVLFFSRLFGAKFVLDAKDDGLFYFEKPKKIVDKLKRLVFLFLRYLVYKNADKLIFLTYSDLKEAKKNYDLEQKKLFIVMNGTNPSIIYKDSNLRSRYRRKFNIPKDKLVVLYTGSLGDEEILEFLDHTKKIFLLKKAFLVLVVSHDLNSRGFAEIKSLEEKIIRLKFRESVVLHKNLDYYKLKEVFSGCDVGVVPWPSNLKTSIPVKTFDYLSSGLAILAKAPKNSELYSFITTNKIGFCYDNWTDFKRCLFSLADDHSNIKIIQKNNLVLARKKFDRKFFEKELISVFVF
ncbi:MAG: hypothetical protein QXD98_03075 [Candidatus Diapherotrites archaeon]